MSSSPPDNNRLKEDIPLLVTILKEFQVKYILVNSPVEEDLKGRTVSSQLRAHFDSDARQGPSFPEIINISKPPKSQKPFTTSDPLYHNTETCFLNSKPALILISFTADMQVAVQRISHLLLIEECCAQITRNRMLLSVQEEGKTSALDSGQPTCRPLIACVRTYNGIGFFYSTVLGVFMGSFTLLLSPFDYFVNPQLWFDAVHKYRVKDTVVTYPMLEHAMNSMSPMDYRTFSLNNMENLMIVTEERPRLDFGESISCSLPRSQKIEKRET